MAMQKEKSLKKPEPPLFHILIGEPDDDCEICRAHGMVAKAAGKEGNLFIEPISGSHASGCICPLCAQLKTTKEGGPSDQPAQRVVPSPDGPEGG